MPLPVTCTPGRNPTDTLGEEIIVMPRTIGGM